MSFIPSCGRCKYCSTGRQYLCNEGAKLFDVGMMSDGRNAHTCKGQPIGRYAQLGTFSEHTLCPENPHISVEHALQLEAEAIVSCSVVTALVSATCRKVANAAQTYTSNSHSEPR